MRVLASLGGDSKPFHGPSEPDPSPRAFVAGVQRIARRRASLKGCDGAAGRPGEINAALVQLTLKYLSKLDTVF